MRQHRGSGRQDGPECRIEVFRRGRQLEGVDEFETLEIVYWLDRSRRDLLRQNPRRDGQTFGTFALPSPVRPNPIGPATVRLVRVEGPALIVRDLALEAALASSPSST